MTERISSDKANTRYDVVQTYGFHARTQLGYQNENPLFDEPYVFPTEDYKGKKNFIERAVRSARGEKWRPSEVLTVLGAQWPLFYLDLWGRSIIRMTAVDANPRQVDIFDSFVFHPARYHQYVLGADISKRGGLIQGVHTGWGVSSVPHTTTSRGVRKRGIYVPSAREVLTRGKSVLLRTKTKKLIARDRFEVVIGNILDFPREGLETVDFVDLSNVPEYEPYEDVERFVDRLSPGTMVYAAEIKSPGLFFPPKLERLDRSNVSMDPVRLVVAANLFEVV